MPLVDGFDGTKILSIGHLGIVAGACDSLQIADVIDATLPKTTTLELQGTECGGARVSVPERQVVPGC